MYVAKPPDILDKLWFTLFGQCIIILPYKIIYMPQKYKTILFYYLPMKQTGVLCINCTGSLKLFLTCNVFKQHIYRNVLSL